MKNQQYRQMANDLLNYSKVLNIYYSELYKEINPNFSLGGTPLNSTIYAASGVVNRFRKLNKSEIVDVIFLTDGEDSSTLYTESNDIYGGGGLRIGEPTRNSICYIEDKENQKRYRVGKDGVTPVLLTILKDRTQCNLIGFYILPKSKKYFHNAMHRFNTISTEANYAQFRDEKYFSISNYGYDQYFLIPGGHDLTVENDSLSEILGNNSQDVSARKLKGAFLKMNKNRLTNRMLLTKVIEEIA
jgi:hypothetical protein